MRNTLGWALSFAVFLLLGTGMVNAWVAWVNPNYEVQVSISGTFAEEFQPPTLLEVGISELGNPRIRFRAENQYLDQLVSELTAEQGTIRLANVSYPAQSKFELLLIYPTRTEISVNSESRRWQEDVSIVLEENYRLNMAISVDEVRVSYSSDERIARAYPVLFFAAIIGTLATTGLLTLQAVSSFKNQTELGD